MSGNLGGILDFSSTNAIFTPRFHKLILESELSGKLKLLGKVLSQVLLLLVEALGLQSARIIPARQVGKLIGISVN